MPTFFNKKTVAESIVAVAEHLNAGEYLNLEKNHIICNKKITLSFKIDKFTEDDVIRVGHGENEYCASFLELSANEYKIFEYTNGLNTTAQGTHGITLKDYVNLTVEVEYSSAKITIASAGGVYQSEIITSCWSGRNGMIYALSKNSPIYDVKLRWICTDFSKGIWLFGDSYFNPTSALRWTSYLLKDGYKEYLLSGYPGRNSADAILDFKTALKHGTPQYAVWCLGMNDPDSDNEISSSYFSATTEFLSLCEEKNITPILATIPCVPERNNSFKNKWIKSSSHRYIDFALAVGSEAVNSSWYNGMLHSDNVHPDRLGAYALYVQAITDFPELMTKN